MLKDKDAIWCWDKDDTMRTIRFWDAKNNRCFQYSGRRKGGMFDNYKKIKPKNEPKWVKKAREFLEI